MTKKEILLMLSFEGVEEIGGHSECSETISINDAIKNPDQVKLVDIEFDGQNTKVFHLKNCNCNY